MFLDFEGFEFLGVAWGFCFFGAKFFWEWGIYGNFCFFGCVWVFGEFVILSAAKNPYCHIER